MTTDTDLSSKNSKTLDGAEFYEGDGLHAVFYEMLYGAAMTQSGDIAWYDKFASQTGNNILDAGCGTGRVFTALAGHDRRFCAFDSSAKLLEYANRNAESLNGKSPIRLSHQRLENFNFGVQFDVILLSYYCFNNLLDADSRLSCLQSISRHLKPGGKVAMHLPLPALLSRKVPAEELESMHAIYKFSNNNRSFQLEQKVKGMYFNKKEFIRSMIINVVLSDSEGMELKNENATVHYACLSADDLKPALKTAGLKIIEQYDNFKTPEQTENGTELILVLAHDVDMSQDIPLLNNEPMLSFDNL